MLFRFFFLFLLLPFSPFLSLFTSKERGRSPSLLLGIFDVLVWKLTLALILQGFFLVVFVVFFFLSFFLKVQSPSCLRLFELFVLFTTKEWK